MVLGEDVRDTRDAVEVAGVETLEARRASSGDREKELLWEEGTDSEVEDIVKPYAMWICVV